MKKYILAILTIAVICGLCQALGCQTGRRLQAAVNAFKEANPGAGAVIPVDENGDGSTDFYAQDLDNDRKADRDDDGNIIEVPGTRPPLQDAEQMDMDIAEIATILGGIVGIPGIGLIGSYWGRRRPIKRLTTVVRSFEKAKQDDKADGYITFSKETLKAIQEEMPGLRVLIDKLRKKS